MRTLNLVRTSAFRLSLLAMLVFAVSAAVLLGFIYVGTVGLLDKETNAAIGAELRGLAEQYARLGLDGLERIISERSEDADARGALYMLVDAEGQPLAGNLANWPRPKPQQGWLAFDVDFPVGGGEGSHRARARMLELPGGYRLLVGRDVEERNGFKRLITHTLGWALLVTAVLSLIAGVLMSRRLLRRVDAVASASRKIVNGHMGERLPVAGTGDEFDRLTLGLNEMLEQIEKLTTGMQAGVDSISHDLRGPLTRLRSQMEAALSRELDVPVYRAVLSNALVEVDRVLRLFDTLLHIAQAEAGAAGMESLDLATVAGEVAELYEPVVEEHRLALNLELLAGAVVVGNRQLLAQAIANLLDNAVKYTPEAGCIQVAVGAGPEGVCLTVSDTGPGIGAADRERVLDRFVRLDASRTSPGSGLGLSLVAAVARLHHAQLSLADNEPGLRVRLMFPGSAALAA